MTRCAGLALLLLALLTAGCGSTTEAVGSTDRADAPAQDAQAEPTPAESTTDPSGSAAAAPTGADEVDEVDEVDGGQEAEIADDAPVPADREPADLVPSDPGPVDMGVVESSRGPGSLVVEASRQALTPEAMSPDGLWVAGIGAPLEGAPECASTGTLAERIVILQSTSPAGFEAGYADNITHQVEVHGDIATAKARAEQIVGAGRAVCHEASFEAVEQLVIDPSGLIRFTTEDAAGTELPAAEQPDGVRTAGFDWQMTSPQGTLDIVRTVSVFNVGPVVHIIEVGTLDNGNADLVATAHAVITNRSTGEPDLVPRVAEVDAAVDRIRRGVPLADPLAGFFSRFSTVEFAHVDPEGESTCSTDYADGSVLVDSTGPVWASPRGASVVGKAATVFVDDQAATDELDRAAEIVVECLQSEILMPLVGEVVPTGSMVDRYTLSVGEGSEAASVDVLLATVDAAQTLTSPSGGQLEADVRAQLVLAVDQDLMESWFFVGLVGDEPDLEHLALDALGRGRR